jgi:hypothetical protein
MEHSLSGFGLKGAGIIAVLAIIGIILIKFFPQDNNLYILGIIAIVAAILIGVFLGFMELAERYKKMKDPYNLH